MKITIGKNKASFEESIFCFQVILSKYKSLVFSIQRPIDSKRVIEKVNEK